MSTRQRIALLLSLLGIGWLGFGDFSDHQLLWWDDVGYINAIPMVQDLGIRNLAWMLFSYEMSNWHPLTWLSIALNHALGAASVPALKITNLVLHGLAAFILGLLTFRVASLVRAGTHPEKTDSFPRHAAIATAILFCVHPQHVESVTWIAERKDLLCGVFYFLAMHLYLKHNATSPGAGVRPSVIGAMLLASMSKSMAVSLPIALIMLDLFPLNRFREQSPLSALAHSIRTKWALISISAIVCVITLGTQSPATLEQASLGERSLVSIQGLGFYLRQFLVPMDFVPLHPFSHFTAPDPWLLATGCLVIVVTVFAAATLQLNRTRAATLAAAGFMIVSLVPVLGVVKVGEQAFADRYAYIPTAPLYVISGFLTAAMLGRAQRVPLRGALAVMLASLFVLLLLKTRSTVETWSSDQRIWTAVVARYPDESTTAHTNLGSVFYRNGDYRTAIHHYERALAVQPGVAHLATLHHLAIAYHRVGETGKAVEAMNKMLHYFPGHALSWTTSGMIAFELGQLPMSESLLNKALKLAPDHAEALYWLGRVHLERGDSARARSIFSMIDADSEFAERARRDLQGS